MLRTGPGLECCINVNHLLLPGVMLSRPMPIMLRQQDPQNKDLRNQLSAPDGVSKMKTLPSSRLLESRVLVRNWVRKYLDGLVESMLVGTFI